MSNAMSIAASGMQAASARLEAAASNIVNSSSSGYQPVSVAQSPAPGGGVSTSLQPVTPAALIAYDPASPYANLQGDQPNVDMATEIVNMKIASHDFRASLLAYKTSSQMFDTLLDATA